ncbi:hypothetical protein BH24ACT25_BH24ACT25_12480 [soil metagenome]
MWAIAEGRQAARAADRHLHGLDAADLEGDDLIEALAAR